MRAVGDLLRRERLRQGLELDRVAADTRINLRYLEAIEAGDKEAVPGGFFYRSFVRQYARALGLEPSQLDPWLEEMRREEESQPFVLPEIRREPIDVPPMPAPASRRDLTRRFYYSMAGLLGAITVCSGVYALWQHARMAPEHVAEQRRQEAPLPSPAAPQPAPSAAAVIPEPTAPPAGSLAAAASEPPVEGRIKIEIAAIERVWLQVRSDQKVLFSNTMQPNQSQILTSPSAVRILIGNAGGIEIRVNGKPIGPIGPKGQVRIVSITPEGFEIGTPHKPQPPQTDQSL